MFERETALSEVGIEAGSEVEMERKEVGGSRKRVLETWVEKGRLGRAQSY